MNSIKPSRKRRGLAEIQLLITEFKARDSQRLILLRVWVFILFRLIAGYGSLIQHSQHRSSSQPISSPP
ncbi:MAG: hypothetical protein EXS25_11500, partial [Pedosphaera sp.]|nr:hypothetical protein [Pedosphaera sp.]